jgi:hypothetical protein
MDTPMVPQRGVSGEPFVTDLEKEKYLLIGQK